MENLALRIEESGINVTLDKWNLGPGANTDLFMQEAVATSDRVLIICTAEYIKKANTGKGGSGSEAIIAREELKRNVGTNKFIPVIRKAGGRIKTPKFLDRYLAIDFSNDSEYEDKLEALIYELHQIPTVKKSQNDSIKDYRGQDAVISEKNSWGEAIITPAANISRTRIHKLNVLWIQLILTNFIIFATTNYIIGMIIGLLSILFMFPLSIVISRLARKDTVTSVLMGAIIIGPLEGGLQYWISKSIVEGLLYGVFYGASLTGYFSTEDKYTNLQQAFAGTLLIVSLCSLGCTVPYGIAICVDSVGDFSHSLLGAVLTIIVGFGLSPSILLLCPLLESFIEKHLPSD